GLYLPIHLSTPIMVGGILRGILEKRKEDKEIIRQKVDSGVLYSSGLIAGEGLIGIFLAILAVIPTGIPKKSVGDVIAVGNNVLGQWGSIIFFTLLCLSLMRRSFWLKTDKK